MYQIFDTIKTFKKILLYGLGGFLLVIIIAISLAYIYQDKIVRLFLEEANEYITTPIEVEKIDFSLIEKFPQAAITFTNITIQEGIEGSSLPLAKAEKLFLTFDIMDLLNQRYFIRQVFMQNGEANIRITKAGTANYNIIKENTAKEGGHFSLNLNKISLQNIIIRYADQQLRQTYTVLAQQLNAGLLINDDNYEITLDGKALSERIQVEEDTYFAKQALEIQGSLVYNNSARHLELESLKVGVESALFEISGSVNTLKTTQLNLAVSSNSVSIATLNSLIPQRYTSTIREYQSKGELYFDASIQGEFSQHANPRTDIHFGSKDASIFHPSYSKELENVSFEGFYTNGNAQSRASSILELKNLSAQLDGKTVMGNLSLSNFNDYRVDCQFTGEINAESLLSFYPIAQVKEAKGLIQFQLGLKGRLNDLQNRSTAMNVFTSGEISVIDLHFTLHKSPLDFSHFNGNLLFNKNDLAISDFSAQIGKSTFLLNGFFKNITAYLLFDNEPLGIEADLYSKMFNVDELLSSGMNPDDNSSQYSLNISPLIQIIFNCKIDHLQFRRFKGENIRGKLFVKDQVATLKDGRLDAGGGKVELHGKFDQHEKNNAIVDCSAKLDRIDVDSIFYVFENFKQDWITDKHLKGQIYAEGEVHIVFDSIFNYKPDLFIADVSATIHNGEMNNFEPMQELSRFIDSESLARLRFSELKNDIHIANQTIYLPEMEIKSNVNALKISGTHTFDQHIDYSIVTPLRNKTRVDKDEAFGAVETDNQGRLNLFLTIKGTTDDYKIAYDTKKVRQKVKEDIKKEGQELKDIFKNKGKKKEEEQKELNEEEYFDF